MDNPESLILTAITKHQRLALDFCLQNESNLFLDQSNEQLAKALIKYVRLFKSKPSKRAMLERHASDADLAARIESFYDFIESKEYNESDYAFDLDRLKNKYAEHKLNLLKNDINSGNLSDIKDNLRKIQTCVNSIKSIEGQQAYERKLMRDHLQAFVENYTEKQKNPDLGKGILTGYSFFDYVKNGLRPADLVIIAGETGSGKSMFMQNMAVQIWMQGNTLETPKDQFKKGYNVTYFSLEMPYDDCFQRGMARLADVPMYGIRDAKLSRAEAKGISSACKFIKNYPHEFDIVDVPRGFSVEQLEMTFEEIKSSYIPDVIFIDYLGLMEDADENGDDWLTLGKLAGKVHEFARAYSIPIVTAVQLNRINPDAKKNEAKAIGLHRIGRSSLIATHSTAIIQLETRQDEHLYDDFIYHMIKNRHGESGKSHGIYKDFAKCSVIDKPYDVDSAQNWAPGEDISVDVSDILAELDD